MKKSVIFIYVIAMFLIACKSSPTSYTINGTVPDNSYNGKAVYLSEYDVYGYKAIDSTIVADGKFIFTGSIDTASVRRIDLEDLDCIFILENSIIDVDLSKRFGAKGSPLNDSLREYINAFDSLKSISDAKAYSFSSNAFSANKNNALGSYILWRWSRYLTDDKFDSIYNEASNIVKNFKALQSIVMQHNNLRKTSVGMPFVDFTIENGNLDGTSVSLSDYVGKGKYVLVDFWASWCKPCIAETPTLVEIYSKYKSNKFELLGVTADKQEVAIETMKKHNITWPQIYNAFPIDLYGANGIPLIILFAPDGTIVARDLRGEALKAKMAEVMKD